MVTKGARVELRIHGERVVLIDSSESVDAKRRPAEQAADDGLLNEDLAAALDEWARVAATIGNGKHGSDSKVATMVSRRGRQLAGRVAETFGEPVHYSDPVSGETTLVRPAKRSRAGAMADQLIGTRPRAGDPVPWLTGTAVALLTAIVIAIAMLALASTLAGQVGGWVAVVATLVVTAGLAPSLWLARKQLIVRWAVLGATCGIAFSWVGVLVLLL